MGVKRNQDALLRSLEQSISSAEANTPSWGNGSLKGVVYVKSLNMEKKEKSLILGENAVKRRVLVSFPWLPTAGTKIVKPAPVYLEKKRR